MFVIAVDTGRWTHITYTCHLFFFGLLKHKILILNNKLFEISYQLKIKKLFIFFFLFFNLFKLEPKVVYHEDLGSFPIYRALEKFQIIIIIYLKLNY